MENKQLTPFKLCVLQNFPFIEADFDALTNYQLLCKVVEYLNKTIEQQNITSTNMNNVLNWFNNLDVTDEIDNKIDMLVADGTISRILNQEILGQVTSRKCLFIGDSYMYGITPEGMNTPYTTYLKNRLRLSDDDMYIYCMPGAGFIGKSTTYNKNFSDLINDSIAEISSSDKLLIKQIFILGGYNDRSSTPINIQTVEQQLITRLLQNYPNAKIYVGMIGNDSNISTDGRVARYNLFTNSLQAYKKCIDYGAIYLNNSENIMKEYNLFASDGIHPTQAGQLKLGNSLFEIIESGNYTFKDNLFTISFSNPNFTGTFNGSLIASNNVVHFKFENNTITLNSNVTNNPSNGITIDLGATDLRYIRNVWNRSLGNTPVRLFDTNNNYYDYTAQILYDDSGHLKLYILTDLSDTSILFNKVQFIENNFDVSLYNC